MNVVLFLVFYFDRYHSNISLYNICHLGKHDNRLNQTVQGKEYNSNNTNLLDVESVKRKLLSTEYVVRELADWKAR